MGATVKSGYAMSCIFEQASRAMTDGRLEGLGDRIAEAIGGRERASAFERESKGAFKRNTLHRWIDGVTVPDVAELNLLSEMTRRPLDFFLPLASHEQLMVPVQKLDVRAAAGGGSLNDVANVEETLDFPAWMARRLTRNVSRLRLLRAHGDSMEPTIRNGALLLVDESDRKLPLTPPVPKNPWDHPDIYVFTHEGAVRVKRLRQDRTGPVLAISDNTIYSPEILRKPEFKIEGRVVWWDNRL
jgi:phage repressor protein C with HTH and peptisase S24 domain